MVSDGKIDFNEYPKNVPENVKLFIYPSTYNQSRYKEKELYDERILIRLQNMNDDGTIVEVNLNDIYDTSKYDIEELSLSANQLKVDMMKKKYKWNN